MMGLSVLAVDWGRVQMAKTELRRSADAAARAGAAYLGQDPNLVIAAAVDFAAKNQVVGTTVTLDPNADIEIGTWNVATKTFIPLAPQNRVYGNAVRVIARKLTSRNDGVSLPFASAFGYQHKSIEAESIVMRIAPVVVDDTVKGTSNPFLAGMPAGSVASLHNPHNSPDYTGVPNKVDSAPHAVAGLPIVPGSVLNFDSIDGTTRHDPNLPYFHPDGEDGEFDPTTGTYANRDIGHNTNGSENGIGDATAPINALVGIFLDDSAPNTSATPGAGADTNYSTLAARDQVNYAPRMKQIFFIGDGMTKAGVRQNFKVPAGATRLVLATWDFYEWNNNAGTRNVKIYRPGQIVTVK